MIALSFVLTCTRIVLDRSEKRSSGANMCLLESSGWFTLLIQRGHSLPRFSLDSDTWGYFGHFYADHDYLLIASATALLRLAPDGKVLWNTSDLGLDGVVVNSVEGGLIKGEGCWDPDEDWKAFLLRLDSGELIIG